MSNLIKGYLPIQISLPSQTEKGSENTFIFVKQHTSSSESSSRTLFVTNTPTYPSIQTKTLLHSLFEKYANVEKILVAPKPKKDIEEEAEVSVEELTLQLFEKEIRSFGADKAVLDKEGWCDQGRYAHVVFKSAKDMKKFLGNFTNKNKNKGRDAVVKFGKLEMQELQDISQQLFDKEKKELHQQTAERDDDEEDDDEDGEREEKQTGFMALVQSHKEKIMPRSTLKQMCDQIMTNYEEAEEEALRKQQESTNQPDEEGFVTVSYNANVGDAVEFEKDGTLGSVGGSGRRKRERSRSTKPNIVKGSDNLQDFYRFQLKESKKRGLVELKNRFQEDLKRVKQMKDDKVYRPF
jgi:ribosomal RNA-processing protein 7